MDRAGAAARIDPPAILHHEQGGDVLRLKGISQSLEHVTSSLDGIVDRALEPHEAVPIAVIIPCHKHVDDHRPRKYAFVPRLAFNSSDPGDGIVLVYPNPVLLLEIRLWRRVTAIPHPQN